jgi:hypothetical protein
MLRGCCGDWILLTAVGGLTAPLAPSGAARSAYHGCQARVWRGYCVDMRAGLLAVPLQYLSNTGTAPIMGARHGREICALTVREGRFARPI